MVDKEYLLEKPPGPTRAKRILDQKLVPFAIDLAGTGEVLIERLSQRTGIRPAILMTALAGGALLCLKLATARGTSAGRRPMGAVANGAIRHLGDGT